MEKQKTANLDIKDVEKSTLDHSTLDSMASFYAIFSDSTRLSIIALLIKHELCVNDIAKILSVSQSVVSHQLATLRKHDIVTYHRSGKSVLYSLTDNHIKDIFSTGIEHISEKDENIYHDRRKKGY